MVKCFVLYFYLTKLFLKIDDRRLDEWVPGDRISAVPVVEDAAAVEPAVLTPPPSTSVSAEEGKEVDKRRSRRIAKRKRDDVESEDMVCSIKYVLFSVSFSSSDCNKSQKIVTN